jgi:hypothetical protein
MEKNRSRIVHEKVFSSHPAPSANLPRLDTPPGKARKIETCSIVGNGNGGLYRRKDIQ